jgi:hypothetical protein
MQWPTGIKVRNDSLFVDYTKDRKVAKSVLNIDIEWTKK